jgi:hypothetical protein
MRLNKAHFLCHIDMNNKTKRNLMFAGCIATRLAITAGVRTFKDHDIMFAFGMIALIIGLSFLVIYLTGARETGPEVLGDKIWWNHMRPIHSALWISSGALALSANHREYAWLPLFLDTAIGLGAFGANRLMA